MKVFLSGEIHSNWREEIYAAVEASNLPYTLLQPNCDHDSSDDVGVFILGAEENNFWKAHPENNFYAFFVPISQKRSAK